ncbi:MAG: DUF481 domain-containing protein [Sandaracinaceae bacterium]|nr:DUF481 domain-containing protein [Sandaracinaceae bacterium]
MQRHFRIALALALALAGAATSPDLASAQAAPDTAAQHQDRVAARNPEDDLRLQLTAGAALAYGNARNFAVNLGGNFNVRRDQHAFLAEVGWIFGMTAVRDDPAMMMYDFGDFAETTNNFTGRLRYDFFVDDDNALFGVFRARRDPFANLEPRVQAQVGYLRNLLREDKHRFWVEIGVDYSYDRFSDGLLEVGGGVQSTDRSLFAARGFIGYTNEINSALTYTTGLEVLWVVLRAPAAVDPGHFRFEWVNRFRSQIEDWLQVSLDITGRFDSQPPGQASPWDEQGGQPTQMFDLITTLNLVGNFDLDGTPAAEEEPACPEPTPCPECAEPTPCPECAEPAPEPEPEPEAEAEPVAEDGE